MHPLSDGLAIFLYCIFVFLLKINTCTENSEYHRCTACEFSETKHAYVTCIQKPQFVVPSSHYSPGDHDPIVSTFFKLFF